MTSSLKKARIIREKLAHIWRRQWQPTLVLLPGRSHGQGSLVGCRLWGRTQLDTTEAAQQQQHHEEWIEMKNVLKVYWVRSHIPRKNQPLKDASGNAAKNLLVRTSRWPWPPVYFSVPSQMGLQMCLNIQSCSTFKNLRNKPADVSVRGCVLALAACGRDILWFQL